MDFDFQHRLCDSIQVPTTDNYIAFLKLLSCKPLRWNQCFVCTSQLLYLNARISGKWYFLESLSDAPFICFHGCLMLSSSWIYVLNLCNSIAEKFPYLVRKKLKEGEEVRRVAQIDWNIINDDCNQPFSASGLKFTPLPVNFQDLCC